jgi:hypothetical protein
MTHRRIVIPLALLWLALVLPQLASHYSFDWDSSQFERGVAHFDIARHQPHPPGYPLWMLALKGLTPIVGHPISAQVALALLFTIAGLIFFYLLARELLGDEAGLAATVLLAFSPLVLLHAMTSAVYAVDLFTSSAGAWFAARLWNADKPRWPLPVLAGFTLALAAGFRPSGGAFLLPLLAVAFLRTARLRPVQAALGMAAGALCWAAWYVPAALITGGFQRLSALTSAQAVSSFRKTSVFYGATFHQQFVMMTGTTIVLAFALAPLALAVGTALLLTRGRLLGAPRPSRPAWASVLFFVLWLTPNLAMDYLFHFGKVGYAMLSLPPLALVVAWLAWPALKHSRWTLAFTAAALLACYFPYERLIVDQARGSLPRLLLVCSPRMPGLLEDSQRDLRRLIDGLPGRPEQKLIFCLREHPDAPNIRTVTCEYSDVYWANPTKSGLEVHAPREGPVSYRWPDSVRIIGWLCNSDGPPADVRARYPRARRMGGSAVYSLWAATN